MTVGLSTTANSAAHGSSLIFCHRRSLCFVLYIYGSKPTTTTRTTDDVIFRILFVVRWVNIASDYRPNELYRTHNPDPSPFFHSCIR